MPLSSFTDTETGQPTVFKTQAEALKAQISMILLDVGKETPAEKEGIHFQWQIEITITPVEGGFEVNANY